MKNLLTTFAILLVGLASAQTSTENYVLKHSAREARTTSLSSVTDHTKVSKSVTYYDGLGRATQSIANKATPLSKNLVTPIAYDPYGRQSKSYLPFTENGTGLNMRTNWATEIASFYTGTSGVANESTYFYGETEFEASMLNRPSKSYAPGTGFRNNPVTMSYGVSSENDLMVYYLNDEGYLVSEDMYPVGALSTTTTVDEDQNTTIEYTDKLGRMILKKSQVSTNEWAETYYIYDERGRLRVVLPPQAKEAIKDFYDGLEVDGFEILPENTTFSSGTKTSKHAYVYGATMTISPGTTLGNGFHLKPISVLAPEFLDTWAFQYEYDQRNRMISKAVPGAGKVLMVYDKWDRLVLTQDANQRAVSEWLFTKYDRLNRPVMTGIKTGGSEATVRSQVASASSRYESFSSGGTNQYTNSTYPTSGVTNYLTVTYYDNYSWNNTGLTFSDPLSQLSYDAVQKGQVTGTLTKAENGNWIKSASYYDQQGRTIQIQSTNHLHTNGKDVVTNYYDFIGQLDKTISSHYDGSATTTITRRFEYDHVGRLLETFHKINNEAEVMIASNEYNELGELIEKDLHSENSGSSFEQSLDYGYNIRGWLTGINNAALSGGDGDLFGMELFYNTSAGLSGQSTVFNGNISAVKWSDQDMSALGVSARGYTYSYDKLNRLTTANHFENGSSSNRYKVTGLSYDLNGNIQALKRQDESTSTTSFMDNLTYTYDGNQLTKVDDSGDDSEGFTETTTGTDYAYDANGNMISDNNKGITNIDYNHLNLPTEVTMSGSGNRIEYLYDAAGIKLQQKVFENSTLTKTTDYVGEFIYETLGAGSRELQLIQHEEGRIIYEEFGQDWDYQYHLKDHLGNTRLTFSTLSQDPLVAVETFETGEDNGFQDLHRHVNSNANTTSGGNEVERLLSGQTGAMVLVGVNKNDVVSLSVQANYESAPSGNSYVAIGSLFSSFDGTYGTIEGGGFTSNSTEFQDAINGMTAKGNASSAPRAFLNYIFFDLNMNYVGSGFDQVSTAALGTGNHDQLQINNYVPDRDGYILAYLSNENSQALTMHFDDFTITQVKTNIVQADDYYPFGLTFNSYERTATTPNKYKYNGMEEQEETGWLQPMEFRMYDPTIARFLMIDPVIKVHESPYAWNTNNPILYADPFGSDSTQRADAVAKAQEFVDKNSGNTWGFDPDNTSPGPGASKVDCSGMVGACMVAGEEGDARYAEGATGNGVQRIADNTEEIDESEVEVGSLVILDNSPDGKSKPFGHIGIIDNVERDADGNITNMTMIDSGGRPSTGKSGPRNSSLKVDGTNKYWGKRITGFRKFDTRPDVYDGGVLKEVQITAYPPHSQGLPKPIKKIKLQ